MEENIKDYLHLYIGCEVRTRHAGMDTFISGKLLGISPSAFHDNKTVCLVEVNPNLTMGYDLKLTTPLLRPLSNMTEEERFEWESKTFIGTDGIHIVGIRQETPESFRYKLSKGFDLFNLIMEGLAIDKTTLKP